MIDRMVGQHSCLAALLVAVGFGLLGCVEYWGGKDRRAAYLSWLWGGLIAIPGIICGLSNNPSPFLAVVAVLFAVGIAFWWQRHRARSQG